MDMKNLSKMWTDSLKFLDNTYVSSIIIFVLFLLVTALFTNINHEVKKLMRSNIFRVIVVLAIIWVAPKNVTIAILLGILYCMSMHSFSLKGLLGRMGIERFEGTEGGEGGEDKDEEKEGFESGDGGDGGEDKDEEKEGFESGDGGDGGEDKDEEKEGFENYDENFENEDNIEGFLPFLSNSQYEANFAPAQQAPSVNCLSTDPNQFDLVGEPCNAVATFEGEYNAQGMEPIMGFNLSQTQSQTAQPL